MQCISSPVLEPERTPQIGSVLRFSIDQLGHQFFSVHRSVHSRAGHASVARYDARDAREKNFSVLHAKIARM